jgi:hypothetical protein
MFPLELSFRPERSEEPEPALSEVERGPAVSLSLLTLPPEQGTYLAYLAFRALFFGKTLRNTDEVDYLINPNFDHLREIKDLAVN